MALAGEPDVNDLHAAALELADAGFAPIPLRRRGKIPLIDNWQTTTAPTPEQIDAWWTRNPDANVGAVVQAHQIVVDIDGPTGAENWSALQAKHGPAPETAMVRTGSGGLHLWFTLPPGVPSLTTASSLAKKVDTRGAGTGQLVMPPSIHPDTGERYAWLCDDPPAQAPAWLCELLRRHHERKAMILAAPPPDSPWYVPDEITAPTVDVEAYLADQIKRASLRVADAGTGERAAVTFSQSQYLGRFVASGQVDPDTVVEAMIEANDANGRIADDGRHTVLRDVRRAMAMVAKQPRTVLPKTEPKQDAEIVTLTQLSPIERDKAAGDIARQRGVTKAAVLAEARQTKKTLTRPQGKGKGIDWPVMKHDKNGVPIGPSKVHIENTRALLKHYDVTARHNLMSHRMELTIPGFEIESERRENATLARLIEMAERNMLAEKQTISHLQFVAESYHPVRDWIRSIEWDGWDHVGDLFNTLKFRPGCDLALFRMLFDRWLVSAVRAVMPHKPGERRFAPQGVLVFQGGQGIGKTRWLQSLAPPDVDWISVGKVIDPHQKDSIQQLTAFWLAELGELDSTFKRSDVAALKAFVTQDTDVYRSAYDRREEHIRRRTVLFASVNMEEFLVDETGNRRWWTLALDSVNWDHDVNIHQMWAQVARMVAGGARWWLNDAEQRQLADSNTYHEIADPLIEDLWATYRVAEEGKGVKARLDTIWCNLPGRDNKARSRMESSKLARELRAAGVMNPTKSGGLSTYRVEMINQSTTGRQSGRSW